MSKRGRKGNKPSAEPEVLDASDDGWGRQPGDGEIVLSEKLQPPAVPSRSGGGPQPPPVNSGWLSERQKTARYSQQVQLEIAEVRAQVDAFDTYADLCFNQMQQDTLRFQEVAKTTRENFSKVMEACARGQEQVRLMIEKGMPAEAIAAARGEVNVLFDRAMEIHHRLMDR